MAGRLLFIILMCSSAVNMSRLTTATTFENKTSAQKPEMSFQRIEAGYIFNCSLPRSVEHNATCNLYVGEESRPVVTTRSSKTNQLFCQFTVEAANLSRHLDSVQQQDASCDYRLENEPNSTLSPRSDRLNLTGSSAVNMSSVTTPTTSESKTAGMQQELDRRSSGTTIITGGKWKLSTVSTVTSPTTFGNKTSGVVPKGLNGSPTATTMTTDGSAVTMSTVTSPTISGNKTSDPTASTVTNENVTSATMDNMNHTFTTGHTDGAGSSSVSETSEKPITGSAATSLSPVTYGTSAVKIPTKVIFSSTPQSPETSKRNLAVVVACFGTAVVVILVMLVLLGTKRRSETSPYVRSQASIKADHVCMTNIYQGGMLPEGNDDIYSEITSVPAAGFPHGCDELKSQEPQNEHLDAYHVYATVLHKPTVSKERTASDQQDTVYSLLQPH